ncbi:putative ADP-ribosylation/crystallin J1 [Paratrimastix pyriformis]|uniref:ADP-ribosylation/crystallin J1 n=1 Tax=Paratrimastix pyriformis TaxID=342808 RepID=A0ABQ8UE06_9EUKA|nr:putative ADP-ribosylation/crystallin J1 [Paratrimastix pyriformis]
MSHDHGHEHHPVHTHVSFQDCRVESDFQTFLEANHSCTAQEYLSKKTESLKKNEIYTIVLDCSDARCESGRSENTVVYCTAAHAITPECLQTLARQFPSARSVAVYGHEFCGGCGFRRTLDALPADAPVPHGATEPLVNLARSLPSGDAPHNAVVFAQRFQEVMGPQTICQSLYYRVTDGAVVQAEDCQADGPKCDHPHYAEVPCPCFKPIDPVTGWDLRLGQDPHYVVFCLGSEYGPTELVHGTPLDRTNTMFEVVSPVFDTHALASLHYCWGHALSATTNTAGCSFNHTATFIMCVSAEREQEGREVLAKLTADPVLVQYTQPHPAVGGTRGEVYFCVHQGGRIVKAQRVETWIALPLRGDSAHCPLVDVSALHPARFCWHPIMSATAKKKHVPKTSEAFPLYLDIVKCPEVPGKLAMTLCPGKHQLAAMDGSWDRNLDLDLKHLIDEYQADTLIPLIEFPDEATRLRVPELKERATALGYHVLGFPIRDGATPCIQEDERFVLFIEQAARRWVEGHTVVVHCMGGLGRTGLVAACIIVATLGVPPAVARRMVQQARRGALTSELQFGYVSRFAETLWPTVRGGAPLLPPTRQPAAAVQPTTCGQEEQQQQQQQQQDQPPAVPVV